jgi:hypothetical protein
MAEFSQLRAVSGGRGMTEGHEHSPLTVHTRYEKSTVAHIIP